MWEKTERVKWKFERSIEWDTAETPPLNSLDVDFCYWNPAKAKLHVLRYVQQMHDKSNYTVSQKESSTLSTVI